MTAPKPETKQGRWQARALAQGRGRRSAADPSFLQVRRGDFVSEGVSHIIPEPVTAQLHDMLSTVENWCFLHVRNLGCEHAYSQVPVHCDDDDPLFPGEEGTVAIAQRLGIKHPMIELGTPRILTTDVVAHAQDGHLYPFFVRYEKDLPRRGTREYEVYRLAREYWRVRGFEQKVYTERHSDPMVNLLIWAFDGYAQHPEPPDTFFNYLKPRTRGLSLHAVAADWADGPEHAVALFKAGLATGRLALTTKTKPTTLGDLWEFRIVDAVERRFALSNFAAKLGEIDA